MRKRYSNEEIADKIEVIKRKVSRGGINHYLGNLAGYSGCLRTAIKVLKLVNFSFYDVYNSKGLEGLTDVKGIGHLSGSVIEKVLEGKNEKEIMKYLREIPPSLRDRRKKYKDGKKDIF